MIDENFLDDLTDKVSYDFSPSENYKEYHIHNFNKLRWLDGFMGGHNGFIAGGCFKNLLTDTNVKDVDIFFYTEADFDKAVELYNSTDSVKNHWKMLYENDKAIAFYNTDSKIRVELIKSVFGNPDEILRKFDFTITKMAYYKAEEEDNEGDTVFVYKLYGHKDLFEHLHMKRLVIDEDIPFPVSTFNRTYRYAKYGYFMCRESSAKLIKSLATVKTDDTEQDLYDANGWD